MNRFETMLMNNPVRAALQRGWEAPALERLGGRCDGARVLEIGCGRGIGAEIILDRFGARELVAIDLDPRMVALARRRLGERASVRVGDAAALDEPDASFDAVFDFGIVHHVPEWPAAIREVARVLRRNGRFYFEEVARRVLDRPIVRALTRHPREDRFEASDWLAELGRHGLHVGDRVRRICGGAWFLGVATRS